MRRVSDSARNVWKKLSARLRELERRNRRLEDVGARIAEFARLPEDEVPSAWFRALLQPASMCGDMHIRLGVNESVDRRAEGSAGCSARDVNGRGEAPRS